MMMDPNAPGNRSMYIVIGVLIVIIFVLFLGSIMYRNLQANARALTEDQLKTRALDWQQVIETTFDALKSQQQDSMQQVKLVLASEINPLYEFITGWTGDVEELKNIIARVRIGKTGYVYVLTYEGVYVVSKDRKRDGENIWDAQASNGVYLIREIVSKGKLLTSDNVDYFQYPWKNKGESRSRDKLTALVNIPRYQWIVGAGCYIDELTDVDYAKKLINSLKERIAAQKIGKKGYIFIISSSGELIVSRNRERDGENVWEYQDARGIYFIQEMVRKARNLTKGRADSISYPWKDKGESTAAMRIAGIAYVPEFDWIIAVCDDASAAPCSINMVKELLR